MAMEAMFPTVFKFLATLQTRRKVFAGCHYMATSDTVQPNKNTTLVNDSSRFIKIAPDLCLALHHR